jgi:hypothetical protein
MNEITKGKRPIAIIILAILTFSALMPALVLAVYDRLTRDPLEVSFRYPSPPYRLQLDPLVQLGLAFTLLVARAGLFILSVVTGIGILKKQRWSWFTALILFALVFAIYLITVVLPTPYTINERLASIVISAASFYFLLRKDVRVFLAVKN